MDKFKESEVREAWQNVIDAVFDATDKLSDEEMDMFNRTARSINSNLSEFLDYHKE